MFIKEKWKQAIIDKFEEAVFAPTVDHFVFWKKEYIASFSNKFYARAMDHQIRTIIHNSIEYGLMSNLMCDEIKR